ncbi:hypothetical protein EsH8_IX_000910 [Colletotrichum jinshuiense]
MRFAGLFTVFSLIASALAGQYIVELKANTNVEAFLAKLRSKGEVNVIHDWTTSSWYYGIVINTNVYTVKSLKRFREVKHVEVDQVVTLPTQAPPVPLPSPISEDIPVALPSPISEDIPVALPSPISEDVPVALPSPISEDIPVPLPSAS